MAHYAILDENNFVIQVFSGKDTPNNIDWEEYYSNSINKVCKKTSYNTWGGIYYDQETGKPSKDQSKSLRKNYAGIGFRYDSKIDAFIPPRPFKSWKLNKETCLWEPPIPLPDKEKSYFWDEEYNIWKERK